MIKWPRRKCPELNDTCTVDYACGFNTAVNACIEAEKNGRMNLDEIYTIIAAKPVTSFSPDRMSKRMKEQAQAIHTALYDDTQADERKEYLK